MQVVHKWRVGDCPTRSLWNRLNFRAVCLVLLGSKAYLCPFLDPSTMFLDDYPASSTGSVVQNMLVSIISPAGLVWPNL